jgi:mycofactocin precursor
MQKHAVQVNSVEAVEAVTDEPTSEIKEPLLLEELLVEEISIDGMCGVY